MAEERTIILKVQLDNKAFVASGKEAEEALKGVEAEMKRVQAESGKQSVEYRRLEVQQRTLTKQLKDAATALEINEQLAGKEVLTRREQMDAQKALAVAYNLLTDAERENTEEGRAVTAQYKAINEALQDTGLAVSDGRLSVGLYAKSIEQATKSIEVLKKEQNQIGYAYQNNTKKLKDAQKGLDDLEQSGDTTSAQYLELTKDVNFYTKALATNEKMLADVENELKQTEAALKENVKQAEAIGFVYGNNENNAKSLKAQLKDLKAELATLDPNSDAWAETSDRAAELADKLKDVNEAISAKATGSKFEQLGNQFDMLVGDLANLDFEGAAEKASAFQQTANSLSFKELSKGLSGLGSTVLSLGKTLLASPIFWVGAVIAGIVIYWDELQAVIKETDVAQEAFNDTLEDSRKGYADASKKVSEVGAAFKAAEKGVISKEEALKIYNDTLGDSLGTAKDLNEAERIYADKTEAFVKVTGLRAQATALFAKAAEEQAKGITAEFEDQTSFIDRQWSAIQVQYGFIDGAQKTLNKSQREGAKEAKKQAEDRANQINKLAEDLLLEAEAVEEKNGIISDSERALLDEQERLAKERADRAKAAAEARLEAERNALENIRQLILGNAELTAQQQQRELDARTAFLRQMAELEISDAEARAKRLLEIQEQYNAEAVAIDAADKQARLNTINSNAEVEIKALEGSREQIAEQEKLIRERTSTEIAALDIEYGQREVERAAAVADAKDAIAQAQADRAARLQQDSLLRLEAALVDEETALREAGKTEEEIAQQTAERRIEIARFQNDLIQADAAKTDAEKLKAQADYEAEVFRTQQEGRDRDVAKTKEAEEAKKQVRQQVADATLQLVNNYYDIQKQRIDEQLAKVEQNSLLEQERLAQQLDAGVISQEKYNAELKKLEVRKQLEENKLKKEQFQKQKQADLITAGSGVAKAIIAGYSTQPFLPLGLAAGTLAATLGAVQLAKIASQDVPGFASGGLVLPSDGVPIRRSNGDNRLVTVKEGEVILNSTQQQLAGGADFFRKIGVPGFATGGLVGQQINTVEQRVALDNTLADAFSRIPRTVDVKDIVGEVAARVEVVSAGNIFG